MGNKSLPDTDLALEAVSFEFLALSKTLDLDLGCLKLGSVRITLQAHEIEGRCVRQD